MRTYREMYFTAYWQDPAKRGEALAALTRRVNEAGVAVRELGTWEQRIPELNAWGFRRDVGLLVKNRRSGAKR